MTRGQPQTRRRALVTGGAIRLGRAIALGLADAGFDVAITYHRSGAAARTTVRDLRRRGVRAVALRADLRSAAAARGLVGDAARALGGLDALVNNAAGFARTPLATSAAGDWRALRVHTGRGGAYGRRRPHRQRRRRVGAHRSRRLVGVCRVEGRARDTDAGARRRVAASRDRRELRRAGTRAQATRSCAGALARNHARPRDAPS